MTDHAIVIGIDDYANADWRLQAAVRDAVAFAKWVTAPDAGRATPGTLTLLLSPAPGRDVDLPFVRATRAAIADTLSDYTLDAKGDGADRLWVFYAGHAVHQAGGGLDAYPVLVPEDVIDLRRYLWDQPLELSKYVPALQLQPPVQQLFFIDACRGIADSDDAVTATTVLHFDIAKSDDVGGRVHARQAAFHATTAGRLANEVGLHGLFSRALLQGLGGLGPTLRDEGGDWVLTFGELARFVAGRVAAAQEDLRTQGRPAPTQVPEPSMFGFAEGATLLRFTPAQVPRARLHLLVEPGDAQELAGASLRVLNSLTGEPEQQQRQGPPLAKGAQWRLLCRQHRVVVDADGFEPWAKLVDLVADTTELATLDPQRVRSGAGAGGLEAAGTRAGDTADADTADADTADAATAEHERGRISARSADPLTLIELFDSTGSRLARGYGSLDHEVRRERPYRLRVTPPGHDPIQRQAYVTSGTEEIDVDGRVMLSPPLVTALTAAHIPTIGGRSDASEVFDGWAAASMGAVLAWGAWAARFPDNDHGQRLRSLGVDPIAGATTDRAYVQVLVGDAERRDWLGQIDVAFGPPGAERPRGLRPVLGLPGLAGQWTGAVPDGGAAVVVAGPDLHRTGLPVPAVQGYVAVVIVAAEPGGQIEIHRYLHPVDPTGHGHPGFTDLVRHQELSWRGLEQQQSFLPGEAERLLADEPLDPLSLAIIGYRLVREGRADLLTRAGSPSVIERMLALAPGLPDAHVVAALAQAADTAMLRAAEAGTPLVADGYSALFEAATQRAAATGLPPPTPDRPLIQGSAWTLLDAGHDVATARPPAIAADAISASPWDEQVRAALAATGRISSPGAGGTATGPGAPAPGTTPDVPAPGAAIMATGSAVLVTPDVLATTEQVVGAGQRQAPSGGAPLPPGWAADFGGGRRAALRRVLHHTTASPGVGADTAPRLALVALDAPTGVQGVEFDWTRPRVGARIAVIGHSYRDPRIPVTALEDAFGNVPRGEKFVVPGEIVQVQPGTVRYEAFTTAGMAGGPVVELDSGLVIGIHFGGEFTDGVKYGFAVPMAFLQHELRPLIERLRG